jgi:lipopolysaccharide/colanic/teichoic acid biosynthesis glycosyltransferase
MLKLRTMWSSRRSTDARWIEYIEDGAGPQQKHPADPRVGHWFARFCRTHSIDELPQFWHVIRGEMSLVGPRPVTEDEMRRYYGQAAREVLQLKPGLAGLWQTSGRNRLSYAQRRELDLEFVRNRSFGMYLRILLRTVPEIWTGSNAW